MTRPEDTVKGPGRAFRLSMKAHSWGATGMTNPGRVVGFVLFVAAALCPFYLSEFKVGLIGLGLCYGLFAFGLDLAWGRAGIVSIGHAVFFGLGLYGVGVACYSQGSPSAGGFCGIILHACAL